jgi:hypothetical protein
MIDAGTTGNGRFAECKILCRMLFISTRQRHSLPSARPGKPAFTGTPQSPAFGKNRPQTVAKVVDVTAATCRHPLPSATLLDTRQSIFLFFLISLSGAP